MYVSRTMTSVVPAVLQLLTVIIGTPLKFIKIASNRFNYQVCSSEGGGGGAVEACGDVEPASRYIQWKVALARQRRRGGGDGDVGVGTWTQQQHLVAAGRSREQ